MPKQWHRMPQHNHAMKTEQRSWRVPADPAESIIARKDARKGKSSAAKDRLVWEIQTVQCAKVPTIFFLNAVHLFMQQHSVRKHIMSSQDKLHLTIAFVQVSPMVFKVN